MRYNYGQSNYHAGNGLCRKRAAIKEPTIRKSSYKEPWHFVKCVGVKFKSSPSIAVRRPELLPSLQGDPGLFGTATGEYFDAAAEFEVFDVAQPHGAGGRMQFRMGRNVKHMPSTKDFFERHNDQVVANQFADLCRHLRVEGFASVWKGRIQLHPCASSTLTTHESLERSSMQVILCLPSCDVVPAW